MIKLSSPSCVRRSCTSIAATAHARRCHIMLNAARTEPKKKLMIFFGSVDDHDPENPRHFKMKKVLASSADNENATKIGKRWREYQGMDNWEGLLDPLDDRLRREIIRYGGFVESTYRSIDFNLSSSSYASCRFSRRNLLSESGFVGTGYRVTKNLTANSGIELPQLAERAPGWMAVRWSWIGFVAVCMDKKEIARLGRRDVVVAFRGTVTCLEWLENFRAHLSPMSGTVGVRRDSDSEPMVETGFLSLYTSEFQTRPSLRSLLRREVSRILEKYGHESLSLTITGHSLGAALAILAGYDIKKTFKNSPLVTVISFAGPRVGNRSFRRELEKQGTKILRIVNSDDIITKVPGFVVQTDELKWFYPNRFLETLIQKAVAEIRWMYADVGCELRLSSRDSPYLNGILNVATCHDLKTYLHLVNGFVGSNCPFRVAARKMMNSYWGESLSRG